MADWVTISSLATAGGTLVLAVATFASVRSANRSARVAEQSLLVGLRPVLIPAYREDRAELVFFGDDHKFKLHNGLAAVEESKGVVYLAMPLRNVGSGLGVLHAWRLSRGRPRAAGGPPDVDAFRQQQRDLYIPSGDTGYWQGATREDDDPFIEDSRAAVADGDAITIDLLYGDWEGGQRTISRFVLTPLDGVDWIARVVRHWRVEGADPRPA